MQQIWLPVIEETDDLIYILIRQFNAHCWAILKNSSNVSGVSVCIFVALYIRMFGARANKVEGTMSRCLGTNGILASI